jgi:hypothetical protein
MGFAGCLGCALIAGGPGLALFSVFVAPKSFLVLLLLARCARRAAACRRRRPLPGAERRAARSLFAWLISLTLTASLFTGARPRPPGRALSGARGAALARRRRARAQAWSRCQSTAARWPPRWWWASPRRRPRGTARGWHTGAPFFSDALKQA